MLFAKARSLQPPEMVGEMVKECAQTAREGRTAGGGGPDL